MEPAPSPQHPRSALALAIAAALVAPATLAQQNDSHQLGALEITGERLAQDTRVVDSYTLEQYQANDLGGVFQSDPEVTVGGGQSLAEKVYVRGFVDALVNVSVDGATQAGSLFHHTGRITVAPELLKQVEVRAGAGRATDGAGALGGAIRFETKDPDDLLRGDERLGALVNLGYASNTDGFEVGSHLFGRLSDRWSALVSLNYSDHDNYEDGQGEEVAATENQQQLGLAKLVGEIDDAQTLRLSYQRHGEEGDRAQRPNWIISGFNRIYPIELTRDTVTLGYALNPAGSAALDLDITVYHTESDLEQDVYNRWGLYYGNTRSIGADVRNTSRLGRHTLTYGTDYRDDRVQAGPAGDTTAEEETGDVWGLYLQDDMALTDQLLLSAGVRFDQYRLTDNADHSFDERGVSPNLSISYQVVQELVLHAGYAEAFRGPMPHGAFKLEGATNDPELQAEEARNAELGFDYHRDGLLLAGKLYRSDIDNAIADELFGPALYSNMGDLTSEGFLIRTGYQWSSLRAGLSFHQNDIELDGQPLSAYQYASFGNTIGDTWVAELDYQASEALSFGWNGRFVQRVSDLETSVGTIDKPGYGVHDVYGRWQPLAGDQLTVTLTVSNLFDKAYLDHASNGDFESIPDFEGVKGLPEPGRDIRLGLAMRF